MTPKCSWKGVRCPCALKLTLPGDISPACSELLIHKCYWSVLAGKGGERKSSLRAPSMFLVHAWVHQGREMFNQASKRRDVSIGVGAWVQAGRDRNSRQRTSDGGTRGKHVLVLMALLPLPFSALQLSNPFRRNRPLCPPGW